MSKAGDIVLKDLLQLYEKWLNQDGLSIQQVGLIVLGSAIACLQEAQYSPSDVMQNVVTVLASPKAGKAFPVNPSDEWLNGYAYCLGYYKPGRSSDLDRPLNQQEVKIVTNYATRNCEHEWEFDEHDTRRCIKCGVERF